MELTPEQADRAAGVLVGTAAGDALGAGYEFTHPGRDAVIEMKGGGSFDWAPGEWTDDTAMAIAVARAATQVGELCSPQGLDAVAAEFVAWFDTQPKDIGNQTREILQWRDTTGRDMQIRAHDLKGLKAGNGSLMRTAPVALAYLDDPEKCGKAAKLVSSLTHYDMQAMQACKLWTLGIRHAVLHGTYDGVREALAMVDTGFWEPLLDKAESGDPSDFPKNGWVVHALQTAWWAITHTDTLPAALELAVRAGGDTDTTAAIAGGLLGARWGASAVPAEWQTLLHGYPGYRVADLVTLTEQITAHGN
ncbi:ADP-ribosylglycohydrolase family protein [Nocardia sp. NBC_00511]|uniref:ADP-ribosylglycohydrolase family protein n=1 Tax=Nocardia sp. NBC_00511 TaxID=2903591 RepID=UPI0030E0399F